MPIPLDLGQEPTPRASKRASLLAAATNLGLTSPSPSNPSSPLPHAHFQQASNASGNQESGSQVLGIQPIINATSYPPKGRHPKAYVWVVRRWLKGGHDNLLERLSERAAPMQQGPVEVRFEWTRAKGKKDKERKGRERSRGAIRKNTVSTMATSSSNTPSVSSFGAAEQERKRPKRVSRDGKERSVDSRRSGASLGRSESVQTNTSSAEDAVLSPISTSAGSRVRRRPSSRRGREGEEEEEEEEDAGNESDPEDSETPWTCTLVLRTLALPSDTQLQLQSPAPTQEVKVKVGAVVPTPHHPKVVSLLKIPFPLPDIDVDNAAVRKRVVTPAGVARPSASLSQSSSFNGSLPGSPPGSGFASKHGHHHGQAGIVLTAEEIKDIVSCTSLWIVVREGFGGVGKERRKGDGWRIRG